MSEPVLLLIGTIISAGISGTVAAVGLWLGRRERSAQVHKLETETGRLQRETEELIWQRARAEIEKMAREIDELKTQLADERERTTKLTQRVLELQRINGTLVVENQALRQQLL